MYALPKHAVHINTYMHTCNYPKIHKFRDFYICREVQLKITQK